jgi:hypothetical protein
MRASGKECAPNKNASEYKTHFPMLLVELMNGTPLLDGMSTSESSTVA